MGIGVVCVRGTETIGTDGCSEGKIGRMGSGELESTWFCSGCCRALSSSRASSGGVPGRMFTTGSTVSSGAGASCDALGWSAEDAAGSMRRRGEERGSESGHGGARGGRYKASVAMGSERTKPSGAVVDVLPCLCHEAQMAFVHSARLGAARQTEFLCWSLADGRHRASHAPRTFIPALCPDTVSASSARASPDARPASSVVAGRRSEHGGSRARAGLGPGRRSSPDRKKVRLLASQFSFTVI